MSSEGVFSEYGVNPDSSDPFEVLGVSRLNTIEEIKAKCELLKREFHPDSAPTKELREDFREAQYEFEDALDYIEKNQGELRETISLNLRTETTSARVAEEIDFRVIDDRGVPVTGCVVMADGKTAVSDSNGRAVLRFDSIGEIEVTAEMEDVPEDKYEPDTIKVQVEKTESDLNIELAESPVTVYETISVRVTDEHGSPVENAEVSAGGSRKSTNPEGYVSFTPTEAGDMTISAEKEDTERRSWIGDNIIVTIERSETKLDEEIVKKAVIEEYDDSTEVGKTAVVKVVDEEGEPVGEARVTSDDGSVEYTDKGGKAELSFKESGWRHINVTKEDGRFKKGDDCYIKVE